MDKEKVLQGISENLRINNIDSFIIKLIENQIRGLYNEIYREGYEEGHNDGYTEGYEDGFEDCVDVQRGFN